MTTFKYSEKVWGAHVLLFRVGWLPVATQVLESHSDVTPENKVLQHQLARVGCRLRYRGEYISKKQHEQETINSPFEMKIFNQEYESQL